MGEAEAEGHGADRFLVYLAVLNLISEAAAEQTVLVVADDAHWLDDASREALLFVARRVEGEHLAVVLAVREDSPVDTSDLPVLLVRGLDAQAARDVLAQAAGGPVPSLVAERLVARTAGNALALTELARSLPRDQLLGTVPLPAELPLTGGVEQAFLHRHDELPPGARTAVLVAAADDSGRWEVVRAAAALLGAGDADLDAAERSHLVTRHHQRVELRHPLVRSAVYAAATAAERRRVHAALAEVLRSPEDADRRAWHRAASAEGPDEEVVAELEAAARRAAGLGGHEAASAAWERSAELTSDPARRGLRFHQAATAAWVAGRPDRAAALADVALMSLEDPPSRADAVMLRARVEWNVGSVEAAHRRVMREAVAVAPVDPGRARSMAMFAASLAAVAPCDVVVDPLSLLGEPATPEERCSAELTRAFVHLRAGAWAAASAALDAAVAETELFEPGLHDLLPLAGLVALHLGRDETALRLHDRLLATARAEGALIMVLYALTRRAAVDLALGRWDALAAGAQEALRLAEATGRAGLTAMPRAWLAALAALQGRDGAAALHAEAERAAADGALGTMAAAVRDLLRWTRALLADSPATALHHLEHLAHGFAERMTALDRLEAAAHGGRPDLARRWVAELGEVAAGTGSCWAAAVAEHGRALLAAGDEVGAHLARALELHEGSPRRVDAARTRLAYGEWLRRARRRVDARVHLRAAMQTFEDLGARRWADRAAQELRASGETVRRRGVGEDAPRLTPTEDQVVRLVAQGLPTREVAAQLFVSPRTVEFHLRNVFTKLGVTSRAELARVTLD
jgi:DNA-binding CsgD family transcriptional regulator